MKNDASQAWLSDRTHAEIFVEPTDEARFLLERVPWFVSPGEQDHAFVRAIRNAVVAPFPQMSFFSFDLQAYLFELLHRSFLARAGHLVGMGGAVTCVLALLGVAFGPAGVVGGAVLFAVWYSAVAERAGLTAWGFVMVPVLAAMGLGALELAEILAGRSGWLWLLWVGFGVLTAASHAGEPLQPPRTFASDRWSHFGEYLKGSPTTHGSLGRRLAYAAWVIFAGVLSELWAANRLFPYNILFLMFQLGYARPVRDELHDRVQRALDSGNPALDYVGIGGATYLRCPPSEVV